MTTVVGRELGKHAGHLLQIDALYLLACEACEGLTLANRLPAAGYMTYMCWWLHFIM